MITPIDRNLVYVFVVAGSVIKQDGKILLVQERKPSAYGLWNLPTGKVEKGYTIEETAIKEAEEETGLIVKIKRNLAIYHDDGDDAIKHVFEASIIGGDINNYCREEILAVRWFTLEEITELFLKNMIRDEWVMRAIAVSLIPRN